MPESRPRALLWIILVSFSVAVVWTPGCVRRTPLKTPAEQKPSPALPEQPKDRKLEAEFEGAKITWYDDKGRPLWKADFREAVGSKTGESALMELRDVRASLYKDGKLVSRLIAPRVTANDRTMEVHASGGVEVRWVADNASAQAQRMIWKSRDDKLVGVGTVRVARRNMEITAHSFVADTEMSRAKFGNRESDLR